LGVGVRAGFEFKLLGPLEVSAGGCPVPIRAAKQRVVLASLLVDTGRVITVDQLITQLWDNAVPAGARASTASKGSGNPGVDGEHGPPVLDGVRRRAAYRPAVRISNSWSPNMSYRRWVA
jgi:Flp pilus assembly protein CpaB